MFENNPLYGSTHKISFSILIDTSVILQVHQNVRILALVSREPSSCSQSHCRQVCCLRVQLPCYWHKHGIKHQLMEGEVAIAESTTHTQHSHTTRPQETSQCTHSLTLTLTLSLWSMWVVLISVHRELHPSLIQASETTPACLLWHALCCTIHSMAVHCTRVPTYVYTD